MTLTKLPKFEMYGEGSQIRRAVKSVKSTLVEGYGRRRYKQVFIKYPTYGLGSCDETTDHLQTLFDTAIAKRQTSVGELAHPSRTPGQTTE